MRYLLVPVGPGRPGQTADCNIVASINQQYGFRAAGGGVPRGAGRAGGGDIPEA